MKKLLLLTLGVILIGFTSCIGDEEEKADIRDQAVGAYNGTLEVLYADSYNALYQSESINFTVSKDENNASSINIHIDNDLVKGVKVAGASNGITFDVQNKTQDVDNDGVQEEIVGEDYFELDGVKYEGAYEASYKRLSFAMSTTFTVIDEYGNVEEVATLIVVTGKKKYVNNHNDDDDDGEHYD